MNYFNAAVVCVLLCATSLYAVEERTPNATFDVFIKSLQEKKWSAAFPVLDDESRSWLLVRFASRAQKTQLIFGALGKKEQAEQIAAIVLFWVA